MDIILDSNIFHSDPTFQGTEFPVLFEFLRATKSRLIICVLVRDEVVERYRDRLNEAVGKFKGLILEDLNVNVDGQVAALLHRMENPNVQSHESPLHQLSSGQFRNYTHRGVKKS